MPKNSHKPRTKRAPTPRRPPKSRQTESPPQPTPPEKKRRRKAMSIGQALRTHGLDEHKIADTYVHVVGKLTGGEETAGTVEKLLVDVLKECSKQIEMAQESQRGPAGPTIVQLVHNVPRPERTVAPAAAGAGAAGDSPSPSSS